MIRKIAILYLVSMLMLLWGVAIGKFKVFPYEQFSSVYTELKAFVEGLDHGPDKSVSEVLGGLFQEKVLSAPTAQLIGNEFPSESGLEKKTGHDLQGYLLLSGLDRNDNRHAIKLIDLSTNTITHKWSLHYDSVFSNTPEDGGSYKLFSKERLRMFHPLLMDDGGIIFNTQEGPLVRIDACSGHVWTNNHHFHHSIEMDADRDIWVNTVIFDKTKGYPKVHLWDKNKKIREDGIARIDENGTILEEISLLKVLQDNGYTGLLYGTRMFVEDRIHANDATPALEDGKYWKKGDLLISLRDLSTVFLYRPSTGKILWLKTGPWLFQHDTDFIDDSKISIFGNQTIPENGTFTGKGASDIFIYDFENDTVSTPYKDILQESGFYSRAEGRSRVLEDGRLFVEETIRGRLMMLSENDIIWSFINRYDENNIGQISWSRYYQPHEISDALNTLKHLRCN